MSPIDQETNTNQSLLQLHLSVVQFLTFHFRLLIPNRQLLYSLQCIQDIVLYNESVPQEFINLRYNQESTMVDTEILIYSHNRNELSKNIRIVQRLQHLACVYKIPVLVELLL